MHRPGDLRAFLEGLGIRPKRSLSQNFLIDGNIIRKIIRTALIQPGDRVLEIGPGPGALTGLLIESGAHVVAVEMDDTFARELPRLSKEDGDLQVINQDILKTDLETLFKGQTGVKVVANLPYHITTPILSMLMPLHAIFSSITVMVQDEVAKRFTASPQSKDWGSISVFLNYYSTPSYSFKIHSNAFYPPPKVDSAIVHFELKKGRVVSNPEELFALVRTAFQTRRKMLRVSLKRLYSSELVMDILSSLSINPQSRPEDLSLDNWIDFYEALLSVDQHSPPQQETDNNNSHKD